MGSRWLKRLPTPLKRIVLHWFSSKVYMHLYEERVSSCRGKITKSKALAILNTLAMIMTTYSLFNLFKSFCSKRLVSPNRTMKILREKISTILLKKQSNISTSTVTDKNIFTFSVYTNMFRTNKHTARTSILV